MSIRRAMNDADTDAGTKAIDSLLNFETVKYFANEKMEADRFDKSMEKYERSAIRINLTPTHDVAAMLTAGKVRSRKLIANELAASLSTAETPFPARLADTWTAQDSAWQRPINEATDKALTTLAESLQRWQITPNGSEGYKKAEVTAGGVDTRELSSQTMESQKSPGLYFIGEVVDVTGWLGGYNFQWAWASANACAQALALAVKA